MEHRPDIALRLAQLRLQYRQGLAQRLNEIEEARAHAEALEACLHRLAGAAGTFGDDDISQAARTALEALRQNQGQDLGPALDALRSLMTQASCA